MPCRKRLSVARTHIDACLCVRYNLQIVLFIKDVGASPAGTELAPIPRHNQSDLIGQAMLSIDSGEIPQVFYFCVSFQPSIPVRLILSLRPRPPPSIFRSANTRLCFVLPRATRPREVVEHNTGP